MAIYMPRYDRKVSLLDQVDALNRAEAKKDQRRDAVVQKAAGSFPKTVAKRSEPYRRFAASLACANCGVSGHSQAAHPPPTGKGVKEDDELVFPLCTLRTEGRDIVEGCHKPFDNYELMPKEQMPAAVKRWVRATQTAALKAGKWPKAWPIPKWWKGNK